MLTSNWVWENKGRRNTPSSEVQGITGTDVICSPYAIGAFLQQSPSPSSALPSSLVLKKIWCKHISDPFVHEGNWLLTCTMAAGKLSEGVLQAPNSLLSRILVLFCVELQFSSLKSLSSRSPCKDICCLGSDVKCLTHPLFRRYADCIPPTSSAIVWFYLFQWWRLIEHQEGENIL